MNSSDDIEGNYKKTFNIVAGVDEAGRGALAGPVVAAAVILPDNFDSHALGINDSKKLSAKKRAELYDVIYENALAVGVGVVDNDEIDRINILQATMKAMNVAIGNLSIQPDFLLIDGNYFKGSAIEFVTIIKGDALCPSISAASIIAKVYRDRIMQADIGQEFPIYDFARNKGYGVRKHVEQIELYGNCKYHRKTFIIKSIKYINNQLFCGNT